jgi:hypothetical protein
LLALAFCLGGEAVPQSPAGPASTDLSRPPNGKIVFLGCNLSDEDRLVTEATLAACGHRGLFLLHTSGSDPHLCNFLQAYRPDRVIPLGSLAGEGDDFANRLGVSLEPALEWGDGPPSALWQVLFPRAERVVVCSADSRRLMLQSACLAGAIGGPLYVLHGTLGEGADLRRQLEAWHTREVFVVAGALAAPLRLPSVRTVALPDERAVVEHYLRQQLHLGPIETLVVANPADVAQDQGTMSCLAPWVALQKRAVLLLSNKAGDNVNELLTAALADHRLRHVDSLILVASLQAIPPERRPNPVPGKDPAIEMEPWTPAGNEPFTLATGRLLHRDAGLVLLTLARQRLAAERIGPGRALVVSNPAGGLPLLETFSRSTAKEFLNGGYQTTTLFGSEVTKDRVRRLLPQQDIFLWEGHHNTMAREYELPDWPEPLPESLVFLQSCLALCRPEAFPLLERGAVAVIGTSTRTYSASGGACSLAFFDALLYEHQSLGGALRHAKNFLLAYSLLKDKRLGKEAKLRGANLRSAWAFTLWGDPTLRLPHPPTPSDALPRVRHEVHGNSIVLWQPDHSFAKVTSDRYQTRMVPNARLAGLVHKKAGAPERRLVPFLFVEVRLPHVPPGKTPRLHSRIPSSHWVFCWDPRRQSGYLLVAPRTRDRGPLRFQVEWTSPESVVRSP